MGVTQKQFDDFRAYMERRFAQMMAEMPNPPVRPELSMPPIQPALWVTLTEDLIKPDTATATVIGSTREIEVGSFILDTGQMVASSEVIGVVQFSNPQDGSNPSIGTYQRWEFLLGRCSQVTEAP